MGETTGISWCDSTFNAWIGCERVSPGCDNCYAERGSRRLAAQHGLKLWAGDRYFTADSYWQKPLAWNRAAQASGIRRRVFGGSYMDPFEGRDDQRAPLARLYSLVCDTPWLDWLLLTKRPEHADRLWRRAQFDAKRTLAPGAPLPSVAAAPWWQPNVWLGVTAEDQARADARIPALLRTKAAVRFVSYEPALERVNFRGLLAPCDHGPPLVDWLIVGGESGPGARPFDAYWAELARATCEDVGTAFFMKQLGDRASYRGTPIEYHAHHGADPAEWPHHLRGQAFPRSSIPVAGGW